MICERSSSISYLVLSLELGDKKSKSWDTYRTLFTMCGAKSVCRSRQSFLRRSVLNTDNDSSINIKYTVCTFSASEFQSIITFLLFRHGLV